MVKGKNGKRTHRKSSSQATFLSTSDIEEGMFRGEKVVYLQLDERDISVIVSTESLQGNMLRVEVLERKGNQYLIGLPGESFSAPRTIRVAENHLVVQ